MRSRLGIVLTVLWLTATVLSGCRQAPAPPADTLRATVSIVPQQYFVQRIGGERVDVNVMVLPGANPATYEPKPGQLTALAKADVYFSIGVPFENAWLAKIAEANKHMLMIDTIADIGRLPMETHHQHEEEEETDEDRGHGEGAPDPHVWLSPELVKVQSQAVYEALAELDPAHSDVFKANLEAFVADIDILEADIEAALSDLSSGKFMVFHPAWGYFARDFGLEQIPVEVGGQEPSARELALLIEEAKEESIQVVFAQPEFSAQDAETIAEEIGGKVLLISPLAPDWLENMRNVAQTFADVLNR
jgi:zinc transport system substrate-binding protein